MRYRFSDDVDAIQFIGNNHADVAAFVTDYAGVAHLSHRQNGADKPFELWGGNGYRLTVLRDDWLVAMDHDVQIVGATYFDAHFTPMT